MEEYKIKIVYFCFLVPDVWESIVIEQLDALKKLELYTKASNIYLSVISDDKELMKLKKLLHDHYSKIEITNHFYENVYEYPGFKTIYEISDETEKDTYILYFHSKGMTSHQHDLRRKLFDLSIANYEEVLKAFQNDENIDVVGSFPHPNGFVFFNFFWVRSSYFKKYVTKWSELKVDEQVK